MKRLFFFLLFLLALELLVIVAPIIRDDRAPGQALETSESSASAATIVALRDGTTLVVSDGSTGREVADWLADPNATQLSFVPTSDPFVGNSASLTSDARSKLSILAMMLRSDPDVQVVVVEQTPAAIGQSPGSTLANERAEALATTLRDANLGFDRVTVRRAAPSSASSRDLVQDRVSQPDAIAIELYRQDKQV